MSALIREWIEGLGYGCEARIGVTGSGENVSGPEFGATHPDAEVVCSPTCDFCRPCFLSLLVLRIVVVIVIRKLDVSILHCSCEISLLNIARNHSFLPFICFHILSIWQEHLSQAS